MDAPFLLTMSLAVLLIGAVLGFGFWRLRRAEPASGAMLSVMAAAASAYDTAKRERLVIATVAEREPDPVAWFARSIAGVVPVYRAAASGAFERVESAAGVGMEPQSLYILERSYPAYMGWARTMQ